MFTLFNTALLGAVIVLFQQFFGMRWFPYILKIPYHYLYPAIIVLGFVGTYVGSSTTFNFVLLLCFAALGFLFDIVKLPTSPFILSFILGPMLESNLRKGFTYTDQGIMPFFTRPISGFLLAAAVFSIVWPYIKAAIQKKKNS